MPCNIVLSALFECLFLFNCSCLFSCFIEILSYTLLSMQEKVGKNVRTIKRKNKFIQRK
nr:MAG TPA: hypothetical protein [Caudoviricetes sp.]